VPEITPSRYRVDCGWEDVPHLDEKTKTELYRAMPVHQRQARSKGTPSLGSGAIYPIDPSEFEVKPFQIPAYWPRAYALDVGWNKTAALWGAIDRSSDCLYLYSEHYQGKEVPSIHANAISARGGWIPGVIDPAARGRSQNDGEALMDTYRTLGLDLRPANNAVEAGIYEVWQRLSTGRIKVFSTLRYFMTEYRLYRRDENGKIVKKDDHLMDDLRYLVMSGRAIAATEPADIPVGPTVIADRAAGY